MKNSIYLMLVVLVVFAVSCSNDEDIAEPKTNVVTVKECDNSVDPNVGVSVCVGGADFASPEEILTFSSLFYVRDADPSNAEFRWVIPSGNMEILEFENSIDSLYAKSIVKVKFNSDFSGGGIVGIHAECAGGGGYAFHNVELK